MLAVTKLRDRLRSLSIGGKAASSPTWKPTAGRSMKLELTRASAIVLAAAGRAETPKMLQRINTFLQLDRNQLGRPSEAASAPTQPNQAREPLAVVRVSF